MFVAANLSLANFDFDLFGRAVFALIAFALIVGICLGAVVLIRKAIRNHNKSIPGEDLAQKDIMKITVQDLMRSRKMEIPEKDKEDFFFGPVSDWRTMK